MLQRSSKRVVMRGLCTAAALLAASVTAGEAAATMLRIDITGRVTQVYTNPSEADPAWGIEVGAAFSGSLLIDTLEAESCFRRERCVLLPQTEVFEVGHVVLDPSLTSRDLFKQVELGRAGPDGLSRGLSSFLAQDGSYSNFPGLFNEGLFLNLSWDGAGASSFEEFLALAPTLSLEGRADGFFSCCNGDFDQSVGFLAEFDDVQVAPVPEPTAAVLFGLGLAVAGRAHRRRVVSADRSRTVRARRKRWGTHPARLD